MEAAIRCRVQVLRGFVIRSLREVVITLRVQAPTNHLLNQNLYCNSYYLKPRYLNIGYLDPLG